LPVELEMNCPECGAPDLQCESRYHECLVNEFTDAGYGKVHHLTVAAYMLQHSSKLSMQGWHETYRLLKEFLIKNKSPFEIRKQNKNIVDSGMRKWKITLNDGISKTNKTIWKKTILNVRLENAEVYCADVTAWAKAVLTDSEEITQDRSIPKSIK
jgi:hypothetical protein